MSARVYVLTCAILVLAMQQGVRMRRYWSYRTGSGDAEGVQAWACVEILSHLGLSVLSLGGLSFNKSPLGIFRLGHCRNFEDKQMPRSDMHIILPCSTG